MPDDPARGEGKDRGLKPPLLQILKDLGCRPSPRICFLSHKGRDIAGIGLAANHNVCDLLKHQCSAPYLPLGGGESDFNILAERRSPRARRKRG